MVELVKNITEVSIEEELKTSYLDYAMSVIVGRALPDVRDGLKPVHRRILFAMHELGNDFNKPYKKSARIVGDVIGKYHPHGDTAIYDTMVRMAQPFSMRNVLIDGQGNFGSVDGDPPAAMRYTEARMSKLAHSLLADLDKETVDFAPNYDETEFAPTVLPTRVPNLLINGSSGIAVGMATNIPTHNLGEIVDGCIATVDNPQITCEELMQYIPGPDFPTAGSISGRSGIIQAYKTGRGRVVIRAKTEIETNDKTGQNAIIITELPFQVNKARLIERIAELVKEKKIDGISNLRDESDKDGMRVVIELRRNETPDVIINNLYAQTQLQSFFGINMVALANGRPQVFTLKGIIEHFINHRREVITRRTVFDLKKSRARSHILEGLAVALSNIDKIVALIKSSQNATEARDKLMGSPWSSKLIAELLKENAPKDGNYLLSVEQAQAILDLKLHRLTGLEQDKIIAEYKALLQRIAELLEILNNESRLLEVIKDELVEIKNEFSDVRRTIITGESHNLLTEDLITPEEVVVTMSHKGYVKYQPLDDYQSQRRGGKGKAATKVSDEDFVEKLITTNTLDTLLCFSNKGKLYWLRVYQIPQASRISKGKPIINLLPLSSDEKITAILTVPNKTDLDNDNHYIIMATSHGLIKKTMLSEFARPRSSGIIAVDLYEDDSLVGVDVTSGSQDVMLFSDTGKSIRFNEKDVRPVGRTAKGSRGIKMPEGSKVIALIIPKEDSKILTVTEYGFGKRTDVNEYTLQNRGGSGSISIQTTSRNGKAVGAVAVDDEDELMLISSNGTLVRIEAKEISVIGRNTKGVKLINLSKGEVLASIERIIL